MIKKFLLAYLLAPVGVVAVCATLVAPTTPSELLRGPGGGPLFGIAILVGVAYVAGIVLLPVFVLLHRAGKSGWQFYVPIGTVVGALTGLVLAWPAPITMESGALYAICSFAGALCSGVFSVVLAWRPNTASPDPANG